MARCRGVGSLDETVVCASNGNQAGATALPNPLTPSSNGGVGPAPAFEVLLLAL